MSSNQTTFYRRDLKGNRLILFSIPFPFTSPPNQKHQPKTSQPSTHLSAFPRHTSYIPFPSFHNTLQPLFDLHPLRPLRPPRSKPQLRIRLLLPPLRRIHLLALLALLALFAGRHKRHIHDLPAAEQVALLLVQGAEGGFDGAPVVAGGVAGHVFHAHLGSSEKMVWLLYGLV